MSFGGQGWEGFTQCCWLCTSGMGLCALNTAAWSALPDLSRVGAVDYFTFRGSGRRVEIQPK